MSSSELESTGQVTTRRGVLCAKCEHLNPPHSNECETCGAHLFLSCKECGEGNERVRTRCLKCGRRLHRSWLQRSRKKMGRGGRLMAAKVVLYCFGLLLVYGLLVLVSGLLSLF